MKEIEIYNGLKVLSALQLVNSPDLSNPEITKPLIKLWNIYLSRYNYKQYETAIYLYAKNNRYFPTVSQILDYMPIPKKYHLAETIYRLYMDGKADELIKEAVRLAGYKKWQLNNMYGSEVERFVKPRIEKVYRNLIEEDQKKDDLLRLTSSNKQIENK